MVSQFLFWSVFSTANQLEARYNCNNLTEFINDYVIVLKHCIIVL